MAQIVYFVQDLLFTSKIRETAQQLGLEARGVRDVEGLRLAAQKAELIILDLRLPPALSALETLAADPQTASIPRVGFIDHEKTDTMALAREKGCTKVLAKGKFSSDLAELMRTRASLSAS